MKQSRLDDLKSQRLTYRQDLLQEESRHNELANKAKNQLEKLRKEEFELKGQSESFEAKRRLVEREYKRTKDGTERLGLVKEKAKFSYKEREQ